MKKIEKIILEIYRAVYSSIGVDFDAIPDKSEDDWFMNYYCEQEKMTKIIDDVLASKRISKKTKDSIKMTLYFGSLPSSAKYIYILERMRDGLIKTGNSMIYIEFDESGRGKQAYNTPAVGRSVMLDPHPISFTWHTTPITEIIENTGWVVKFKTENSEYVLRREVVK